MLMLRCPLLREIVYRSHATIASAQSTMPTHLRPAVYKEWSECQMERALKAVISEGLSLGVLHSNSPYHGHHLGIVLVAG